MPTIMKLNIKKATKGLDKVEIKGIVFSVTINLFWLSFNPINNKGGATKASTRCSAE